MAIQKEKALTNGTSGNYWKIISEYYDRLTGVCRWEIALFKCQATSSAHGTHLGLVKRFERVLTPEEGLGNRTTVGYSFIQTKADSLVIPITGGDPRPFDTDLAGGTSV